MRERKLGFLFGGVRKGILEVVLVVLGGGEGVEEGGCWRPRVEEVEVWDFRKRKYMVEREKWVFGREKESLMEWMV